MTKARKITHYGDLAMKAVRDIQSIVAKPTIHQPVRCRIATLQALPKPRFYRVKNPETHVGTEVDRGMHEQFVKLRKHRLYVRLTAWRRVFKNNNQR